MLVLAYVPAPRIIVGSDEFMEQKSPGVTRVGPEPTISPCRSSKREARGGWSRGVDRVPSFSLNFFNGVKKAYFPAQFAFGGDLVRGPFGASVEQRRSRFGRGDETEKRSRDRRTEACKLLGESITRSGDCSFRPFTLVPSHSAGQILGGAQIRKDRTGSRGFCGL